MSVQSLSGLDWCLLIFIFLSTVGALRRGLIRVVFSLAGLVAGVLIASWNYLRFSLWLNQWIRNEPVSQVVAFLLLLVGIVVLTSAIAGLFKKTASAAGLGIFDRLFGAAFGFIRGILLASVAIMALVAFVPDANMLKRSQLAGYLLEASHKISRVAPTYLQEQLAAGTSHLLQQSPKPFPPAP